MIFLKLTHMLRLLMSKGKAVKRLDALANCLRVPLRPVSSGMINA